VLSAHARAHVSCALHNHAAYFALYAGRIDARCNKNARRKALCVAKLQPASFVWAGISAKTGIMVPQRRSSTTGFHLAHTPLQAPLHLPPPHARAALPVHLSKLCTTSPWDLLLCGGSRTLHLDPHKLNARSRVVPATLHTILPLHRCSRALRAGGGRVQPRPCVWRYTPAHAGGWRASPCTSYLSAHRTSPPHAAARAYTAHCLFLPHALSPTLASPHHHLSTHTLRTTPPLWHFSFYPPACASCLPAARPHKRSVSLPKARLFAQGFATDGDVGERGRP